MSTKIYTDGQEVSFADMKRIIAAVGGKCLVGYGGEIPQTLSADQVIAEVEATEKAITIHSNYGNGLSFREGDVEKEHEYITLPGKDFSFDGYAYILEI